MNAAPTVIISGMIAADPHQGGATWAVLQYLLGFQRLGWRVCFIEPINKTKCKPEGTTLAHSVNARYFNQVMEKFGLKNSSALLVTDTQDTVGLPYKDLITIAESAQLVINIAGMLTDPALLSLAPVRVYLDLDPAFVQIWNAQGIDMRFAGHTHFVTVGKAIGSPQCWIPTNEKNWLHTWPPVVLDQWPASTAPSSLGVTTVGNWRAYGSVTYNGHTLGQKVHSIRPLMDLPVKIKERVTLAMTIDPAEFNDLSRLHQSGWRLIDPYHVAGTPSAYRNFLSQSKAEIGITKQGYVASGSGWFSDRSVCYLASGRPVIAQETGWSDYLPGDQGLLPFSDSEQAAAAVDKINQDPLRHAAAARWLAEQFFDSDKVLRQLLDQIGATP